MKFKGEKEKLPGGISGRNAGEKRALKAKSIILMENHKTFWRNSPAFLQQILQLIMEKNEECCFNLHALYMYMLKVDIFLLKKKKKPIFT